jgi:hypothetical protein
VVTHLKCVIITVVHTAYTFDRCTWQRVFAHGNTEYNALFPSSYLLPHAHAQGGKVIGLVVVVVTPKIGIYRDLGT